ncbi:MAG: hypothetical protein ACRD4Y_05505, partial [Candidatus Acidiferrales bacterium]
LMVVFMVATILVLASATVPNILTEGRREREAETIWRGEQYERAIGLYFQKTGKYPTKIDDLTNETNGVRFLRKAYKDPLNKEDGSWRMIYVGPNGQLIGSLTQVSLMQIGPTAPGGLGGVLSGGAQPGAATIGVGTPAPGGAAPGTVPKAGAAPGLPSGAASPNPLESQPQPLEGDVIGGNIVGVASKMKMPSLRVYNGEDTYQKWEFIWNPNQNGLAPGAPQPGQPVPGAPGAAPQTPGVAPQTPQGMPQIPGGISDQPPPTSP